jgi:hypothetical protein
VTAPDSRPPGLLFFAVPQLELVKRLTARDCRVKHHGQRCRDVQILVVRYPSARRRPAHPPWPDWHSANLTAPASGRDVRRGTIRRRRRPSEAGNCSCVTGSPAIPGGHRLPPRRWRCQMEPVRPARTGFNFAAISLILRSVSAQSIHASVTETPYFSSLRSLGIFWLPKLMLLSSITPMMD